MVSMPLSHHTNLQNLLLQVRPIAPGFAQLNDMVDHQLGGLGLAGATLTAVECESHTHVFRT